MRAPSLLSIDEGRRGRPDRPTSEGRPARRSSGRGTCTRGDSQHGRPVGLSGNLDNGSTGRRARQESEGLIVLWKPGNAGGGKEPWFEVRVDELRRGGLATPPALTSSSEVHTSARMPVRATAFMTAAAGGVGAPLTVIRPRRMDTEGHPSLRGLLSACHGYNTFDPFSPERIRTACSTRVTKIFPSPGLPVEAAL